MSEDIFDKLPPWLNLGMGIYFIGIPASGVLGSLYLDQGAGMMAETPGLWLAITWTVGWPIVLLIVMIALLGIMLVAKSIHQLMAPKQNLAEESEGGN